MKYLKRNGIKMLITFLILAVLLYIAFFWSNSFIKKKLPLKYSEYVEKYSLEYSLDKYLVYSVISAESDFNEKAQSSAGAMGLMQLMPDTAKWINEKYNLSLDASNLFDAETNIHLGCCYLNYLSGRFNASVELIIAAYNGGEGNVAGWLKNEKYSNDGKTLSSIPYKETSNYLKKVLTRYEIYQKLYS